MMNLIRIFYVIYSAISGAIIYEALVEQKVLLGIVGMFDLVMICTIVITTEKLK